GVAGSLVTLNDTGPTNHSWNLAAVEIMPAATSKPSPSITWTTPAAIVSGTALGAAQLNATASVPGTFVYGPPPGTLLSAGNGQTLSVTFYPADTAAYQQATATVLLNVLSAAPTVTWSAPAPITFGTALSSTQLNATADSPVTHSYSSAIGTVLPAGDRTLSVTFTPANTAYAPIVRSVPLTVLKQTPVITCATPANIVPGTALSTTQLNASASVNGTLTYSPALGTVLSTGPGQRLSVTFIPTDSANVAGGSAAVAITVAAASAPATPTPAKLGNL